LGKIANSNNATIIISVLPNTLGVITNTVSVGSSDFDSNTSNNTDTENTTIFPADISVTKSDSPDPVFVENPLTYTLVIENDGPNQANNVALTDTLPPGVAFKSVSGSASCAHSSGTVTCSNLGNIGAGGSRSITIVVTPTVAGVITNTAIVTSSNPDLTPSNNTTSITTTVSPVADLSIGKIASSNPITAGTSLTYTLFVTNIGPSTATNVLISDTLPGGVTFVSAPGCTGTTIINCSIPTLTAGSSVSRSILVNVNSTTFGPLVNTATVTGNEFDSNTINNTTTLTTIVSRQVSLSLTKSDFPDPVAAGASLTYTLTISNAGPSSANGVVVTDTLPANVTVASAPGCSGTNPLICSVGTVASGGTAVVTIRVTPASSLAAGTILTNTATVSGTESDSNPANNTAAITTTVIRRTDLSITKSDTPDPVIAGNNVTYNVIVTNNGPSNATGVVVTDTLPAGVTLVSAPGCTGTTILTCNLGNMASGGQASISIVVSTNLLATGSLVNSVNVSSVETDPNPGNNSTSATTSINPITFLYLPIVIKPGVTDLFIENDTGGVVTFTVLGAGVSCTVPAGDQNFFCGSFPPGTYTVQVTTSTCGNGTFTKTYVHGPQSTQVHCNN
jgi:uncharacterized repeat protein (TIGR01451 family)